MTFKEQCDACPEIAKHHVQLRLHSEGEMSLPPPKGTQEKVTLKDAKLCDDCLHIVEVGFGPFVVGGVEYYMWNYQGKV